MLPLERDVISNGRASQASNISAVSRVSRSSRGPAAASDAELAVAPGVQGMLRTSTDVGNVDGLTALDSFPIPAISRGSRRGATSRMPSVSSVSIHSNRNSTHPHPSHPRHRSRESNVPHYVADTLSPTKIDFTSPSPYFPPGMQPHDQRDTRNGYRSNSMTTQHTAEPMQLPGNRSCSSLWGSQLIRRPVDAYRIPHGNRRFSQRPSSPAFSEPYAGHSERGYGPGGQHAPSLLGQERLRTRSNMSLRGGAPVLAQSPVIFAEPHPDIPPVPPLVPHRYHSDRTQAFDRVIPLQRSYPSVFYRPAPSSASSGSTSRRGDSEPPSSDATGPPTPTCRNTVGALGNPGFVHVHNRNHSRPTRKEVMSCLEYYDGSEAFADGQTIVEPDVIRSANGFFRRMNDIIEEKTSPEPSATKNGDPAVGPAIAELTASPVPQRLTKEVVRSKIPLPSPTIGGEFCEASVQTNSYHIALHNREIMTPNHGRYSILSQAEYSLLDSPTVDLARCVYRRYADGGLVTTSVESGGVSDIDADAPVTTKDGMSDLLEGYQHTDMKQETSSIAEADEAPDQRSERRSSYTPRSSDIQSFKSCADGAGLAERPMKVSAMISLESPKPLECSKGTLAPEPLNTGEPSAKSLGLFKDVASPEDAVLKTNPGRVRPVSKDFERDLERSASTKSCSAPKPSEQKKAPQPVPQLDMSNVKSSLQATSDVKQDSVVTFESSSKGSVSQPPSLPVPRRESSSSKEAQRTISVGGFLSKCGKITKSTFVKSAKKGVKTPEHGTTNNIHAPWTTEEFKQPKFDASQVIPTPPPMRMRPVSSGAIGSLVPPTLEVKVALTGMLPKVEELSEHNTTSRSSKLFKYRDNKITPISRMRRTPSGQFTSASSPGFSSYSPIRIQTSLGFVGITHTGLHHDGPPTTHLSWPAKSPSNVENVDADNGRVVSEHAEMESTAIDMGPRTPLQYQRNHIPDLKEDSHDGSSLNTSVNDLEHSSFRFPSSGQANLRVDPDSLDDSALFDQTDSMKSPRKSLSGNGRCLPPMEFSEMDLLEKLDGIVEHRGSRSMDISPKLGKAFAHQGQHRAASVELIRESRLPTVTGRLLDCRKSSLPVGTAVKKRLTPQELKESVDNVDIPTVDGLSLRVCELMPSIKQELFEEESAAEQKMLDDVRENLKEVGGPAPKQSVARLRPVPGQESVVLTYDGVYVSSEQLKREDISASAKELDEIGATKGRSWSVAHIGARDKTTLTELARPSPALRSRSLSLGHQELRISSDSRQSPKSARSLDSTPADTITDTRPWNRDENYPWATTGSVEIDISLPPAAAIKSSPRPRPSYLRHRLSASSSTSGMFSPEGTPGSSMSPASTAPALGVGNHYALVRRESQRRWTRFVSSGRQSIGPPSGFDASGFATAPVRVRDDDQSHGAGDRYPTKLLLPSYLHIADSTSRLSDYTTDEDLEPLSSPRSRLVRRSRRSRKLETGRPKSSRAQEVQQAVGAENSTSSEASISSVQPRQNRRTFSGAEGMSRWTYLSSKVVYKVKTFYHRIHRLGRRSRKNNDGGIHTTLALD